MTIGDVIAADRDTDLAFRYVFLETRGAPGRPGVKLSGVTLDLLTERDAAAGGELAWAVWRKVVIALRSLLRDRPPWQGWEPIHPVRAIHDICCFRWAPPVARDVAPARAVTATRLAARLARPAAADPLAMRVVEFWAGSVTPGGATGAFLKSEEVHVGNTPGLDRLVCRECNRLMPLTPSGRTSRRSRCERCKKAKENAAWKARDPEKARELVRNAMRAYRHRLKGGK